MYRKGYVYYITSITSKTHLDKAKNDVKQLSESLLNDSKMVTKLIKTPSFMSVSNNVKKILQGLVKDVNLYEKSYNYVQKNKNVEPVYLDIVDASYNFRFLKLKTLKGIQKENEILEERTD